jgi:hypothetical protein
MFDPADKPTVVAVAGDINTCMSMFAGIENAVAAIMRSTSLMYMFLQRRLF